jgi:hypothetical protein
MANGSIQKRSRSKIQDSFLEALRGLSGKSDLDQAGYPGQSSATRGSLNPNQPTEFGNPQAEKYKRLFFQEKSLRREEHTLRVHEDQEAKMKINAIRQELQKMASSYSNLNTEIKVAVMQTDTLEANTYTLNFLDQLKNFIYKLRRNAEAASHWLSTFNQRSKKKGYYWGQVKKKGGGANFYLSADRYSATQAG